MLKKFSKILSVLLVVVLAAVLFFPYFTEADYRSNDGSRAIQGELIVSIDAKASKSSNSLGAFANASSFLQTTNSKVNSYVLESLGVDVIGEMAEVTKLITAPRNASMLSANGRRSSMISSNAANAKIEESMGNMFLVKYDLKKYRSYTQAINDVRAKLERKGIKVKYIEPNLMAEKDNSYNSNFYNNYYSNYASASMNSRQEWHYNMINVPGAWKITTGSTNVKVAVLDTGIDYNHVSLSKFVDMSLARTFYGSSVMDDDGHGTHVAGTIASYGSVSGVMKNATLVPIKVLNGGSGSNYYIQQGIIYAAQIGADVINMSLGGGGYSQAMYNACQYAVDNGTVVVAAAGNDGTSYISYPAGYDNVIAVGSVGRTGRRSSFSQYGQGLEIMAPGESIYSTYPQNRYTQMSGTSMATPHVSGVVGLMKSVDKSLSVAKVRDIIAKTATRMNNTYEYGNGIINAEAAVNAVAGGGSTNPTPEVPVNAQFTVKNQPSMSGSYLVQKITVYDKNGKVVSGADVVVKTTTPYGKVYNQKIRTNSYGYGTVYSYIKGYGNGTYKSTVTVTKTGFDTYTQSWNLNVTNNY